MIWYKTRHWRESMTTAAAAAAQQERRRRKDFRLDSCWERRMQMSFSREQVWESHYLLILRASYYCMLKEGALFFFQQEIFSFVFCQLRVSSSSFEMCAKIWMALRRQVGDSQQTGQTRTRSFDFWTKKVLVPPAPMCGDVKTLTWLSLTRTGCTLLLTRLLFIHPESLIQG